MLTELQRTALNLSMRLVKNDAKYLGGTHSSAASPELLSTIIRTLVEASDGEEITGDFVENYVEEFDDVRFYTFSCIAQLADKEELANSKRLLFMLAAIKTVRSSQDDIASFFFERPSKLKSPLLSLPAHKRHAQEAWLGVLRLGLCKDQRKMVLGLMSHQIAPWFVKVELLMDFLTDSYNVGGSMSLLALSGLFYLMQEKNLDYPLFYHKLYSLLNAELLHSRHRSRFFRLLDTFLASTHLPAALVASFIKRLSRLALHAPPAGIVVVIPWIYNLLKKHPTCTFMIHREVQDKSALEADGMDDPFDLEEPEPMKTHAIDSSLWEVEMLQSHYHPNVATLAKIISEQFTKSSYNIEDFLDHSYGSMLDAELSRGVRKAPVVEYEIPKKIFFKQEVDLKVDDSLLVKLWDFTT
ncbi:MAG: hypothetical protein M1832_002093 [Thelocarpon impressellum]|nr:MAG: hypothetical protein M1832_002093 [Thelocarpon impressellum]